MKCIKRNGEEVVFDAKKIRNAIAKANVDPKVQPENRLTDAKIDSLVDRITAKCEALGRPVSVEEIQDMVCYSLMDIQAYNLAMAYIEYRHDRERVRDSKSLLMKQIGDKLMAHDVQNSNANLDERSFSGRMKEADSVIMKEYALNNCMSEMAKNNHLANEIYIHDLDSYAAGMHNCLTIPFDDLLENGFHTRQTDVRSPRSIGTAMQLVAVLMQLQSLQQFGGVSASHIDWTMVPYVRYSFFKHFKDGLEYVEEVENDLTFGKEEAKDVSVDDPRYTSHAKAYKYAMDMTVKETHQAVEAMYHNLKIWATAQ